MRTIHSLLSGFLRDRAGNIAISAGLTAPLLSASWRLASITVI